MQWARGARHINDLRHVDIDGPCAAIEIPIYPPLEEMSMNRFMTINQSLAALFSLALWLLSVDVLANDTIRIPERTSHQGSLETRNGAIYIGDGATIDGDLDSRNGRIEAGQGVQAGEVSSRNGVIALGANGRFGDIATRNGNVTLGAGIQTGDVETRNGSIVINADSRTGSLESRNGSVQVGPNSVISGDIETRNGRVSLISGAVISGDIESRNGSVELSAARVDGVIRSRTGDIVLREGSQAGSLVIDISESSSSGGWFGFGGGDWPEVGSISVLEGSRVENDVILLLPADYDEALPEVRVAAGTEIGGDLTIDSRVDLLVEGQVRGRIERVDP